MVKASRLSEIFIVKATAPTSENPSGTAPGFSRKVVLSGSDGLRVGEAGSGVGTTVEGSAVWGCGRVLGAFVGTGVDTGGLGLYVGGPVLDTGGLGLYVGIPVLDT